MRSITRTKLAAPIKAKYRMINGDSSRKARDYFGVVTHEYADTEKYRFVFIHPDSGEQVKHVLKKHVELLE